MKRIRCIGLLLALLLALAACDTTTREARRMVKQAELLADTLPDSTVRLIDSVLHMPVYFSERERMDMALLQAEALFGDHGQDISPVMDDDFFDSLDNLSPSPELERAAAYFAQKKQYAKAAHAALYSGFVQQHYDEKEAAMRSFKEAERYGKLVDDSLTVAHAEYWMGKMLYEEGRKQEALLSFKTSSNYIGQRYAEQATIENSKAIIYMLLNQNDSSAFCLQQSIYHSQLSGSDKVKHKALNNYSVLYRKQGKFDQSVACLRQMANSRCLNESERFVYYLNMGRTFMTAGKIDSVVLYSKHIEDYLPTCQIKPETKVSTYDFLFQVAEIQGDQTKALRWKELHERTLYEVMFQRQEQNVYRIQQQYDYESLQNEMNRKLIQRQRLITFIGLLAIIGLTALAISQIRLAKTRKQEAEAKNSLFHFMKQNKELVESNMEHEKKALDTTQQLSDLLYARLKAMQKLDYCLKTPKDKIALKDLEKEVFGEGDHWEAVKEVLVALYPGLWETLKLKYPDMDEMERRVFMLSYLKLSRLGEATLLGISTSVLDKLRTKVRKVVEQDIKQ